MVNVLEYLFCGFCDIFYFICFRYGSAKGIILSNSAPNPIAGVQNFMFCSYDKG